MDLLRIPRRFRDLHWPRPFRLPPTKNQSLRKCHQRCCECDNLAHEGRLRPPDEGSFIPLGWGLRWWCHECVAKGRPDCSGGCRGKALLRRWLVDLPHRHVPLAQFEGQMFDFYLPASRLVIDVVSNPGLGCDVQQRNRHRRDQVAARRGFLLLRVHPDDPGLIEHVRQAVLKPRPR